MDNQLPEKDVSIQSAIASMRANRPLRAEETCRDYLHHHPGCTDHLRLLSHALMKQNRLQEAGLKLHHLKRIPLILFYGSQAIINNRVGTRHGDMEDLAGIQNVQQCLKKH